MKEGIRPYIIHTPHTNGFWIRKCNSEQECNRVIAEQKKNTKYIGPATVYKLVHVDSERRPKPKKKEGFHLPF